MKTARTRARKKPFRWVFAREIDSGTPALIRRAGALGFNGLVVGVESLFGTDASEYARRARAVKQAGRKHGVEIIPCMFNAGYGGELLARHPYLAEGLPVRNVPLRVRGRRARFEPGDPVEIVNGGFERHVGDAVVGYDFQAAPGEQSFIDRRNAREGGAALRFENLSRHPHRYGRLVQRVSVRPRRSYRLSCWLRTEGLEPSERRFRILVRTADERWLVAWGPPVPATGDWRRIVCGFNSLGYRRVAVHVGDWGATGGRYWVGGLHIEETGPINVLRRPGAPVIVRGEETGRRYREGEDYLPLEDPGMDFQFDHEETVLHIPPGSRIRDGERLRISHYQGFFSNCRVEGPVFARQASLCMSEPELYELWRRQLQTVQSVLAPETYFLSMDEVRAGGSCLACRRRRLSLAEIIGDCVTRQYRMIRRVNPSAEIAVWSDMFDPFHNAREGRYLFLAEGDAGGSWRHIPKDLVIACWNYGTRRRSLGHFAGLGFRTLAAAHYDDRSMANARGWMDALARTEDAAGMMYTTWIGDYSCLEEFARLTARRQR